MGEHKNKTRAPLTPLNIPTLALSTGGLGFLRPAPGTWGSMPPPALIGLLLILGVTDSRTLQLVTLGVLVVSSVICVVWGGYAERRFARKDAPEVVIDETAGVCPPVLIAVIGFDTTIERIIALGAAFFFFRAFDVVKPWPARRLEQLPRGWGVLIDDLAAGLYAMIAMIGFAYLWRMLGIEF